MENQLNRVHWLAAVAAFCSFWFLLWFTLFIMFLLELITLTEGHEDLTWYSVCLVLFGIFTLMTAFRGWSRLQLLRHGRRVTVGLDTEEYEVYDEHTTIRNKRYHYQFKAKGKTYKNTIYFRPIRKGAIEIIYNVNKPEDNAPIFHLPVYFNASKNAWYASIWRVVLRLAILVAIFVYVSIA
ncbi:hypothetical protein AAFJ72_04270 [Brevibacillus gelatini]|uniref:hypothetical protein n=1 Tax=Brevibacillus gelatini TaxID=1655277 RepID=UPI003D81C175